jgi:excisionase family DNA binding protein
MFLPLWRKFIDFSNTFHYCPYVATSGRVWIVMVHWMTIEELASYLKKPKSTLYKLVATRKLRGYKVGRSWRFDRAEVDSWVRSLKPGPRRRAKR